MAGDELFKRYLEIGASVLGMTRERAESIVKDLVASGEVAKGQATKAADWLVERGRTGTEEVTELVRREIRQQVTALGLATRDDIARLESQLEELRAVHATRPAEGAKAVEPAAAAKAAARPRKAKGPPDGNASGTRSAGISRAGSVRKRPGESDTAGPGESDTAAPDAAPPAGGADSSKG